MDFLNDFSPMMRAKPKSQSFVWGIPDSEVSRTFSGFRSQWTMSFLFKYCSAIRIWRRKGQGEYVRNGNRNSKELLCRFAKWKYLVNQKFGDPLWQSASRTAENHLQHVSIHLLHHNVNLEGEEVGDNDGRWSIMRYSVLLTFSGDSNIRSKQIIPGWSRFWGME